MRSRKRDRGITISGELCYPLIARSTAEETSIQSFSPGELHSKRIVRRHRSLLDFRGEFEATKAKPAARGGDKSARWRTASSNLCKSNSGRASIRDRRDRVNDLFEPTRSRYWKLDVRLAYQFLPTQGEFTDATGTSDEPVATSRTTIP